MRLLSDHSQTNFLAELEEKYQHLVFASKPLFCILHIYYYITGIDILYILPVFNLFFSDFQCFDFNFQYAPLMLQKKFKCLADVSNHQLARLV